MFNSSRKKIVASIMSSVILLFVITLSVILLATRQENRNRNEELLERYIQSNTFGPQSAGSGKNGEGPMADIQPGKQPRDGQLRNYELTTFYSVKLTEDGTVLAVDDGNKSVYSEEDLIALATNILDRGKDRGSADALTYRVSSGNGVTMVAFVDTTLSDSSMDLLLRNVLIVGCAGITVLFFLSMVLSKQIIRPLEDSDRRQKQFISDASHELKTPVAVISTNAELLSREVGQNEWLENIRYENARMGDLVTQLLELSRAENAETAMESEDLSRIVTGEVLTLESLAFEQGKSIRSEIAEHVTVTGNRSQLTQLVSILLDNAIRHTTGDEIGITLEQQSHMAVLRVSNEGEEIRAEQLSRLFDRFYRVDEARSGEERHYGLGLSIAKAITEKHGGRISVACADGIVCFTVWLPHKK